MSDWLRTRVNFKMPMANLVLPRDEVIHHLLAPVLGKYPDAPDVVEAACMTLIRQHRPDLIGGILAGMHFDYQRFQWVFVYAHPSLPRVADGEELPRFPLVPDDTPVVVGGR